MSSTSWSRSSASNWQGRKLGRISSPEVKVTERCCRTLFMPSWFCFHMLSGSAAGQYQTKIPCCRNSWWKTKRGHQTLGKGPSHCHFSRCLSGGAQVSSRGSFAQTVYSGKRGCSRRRRGTMQWGGRPAKTTEGPGWPQFWAERACRRNPEAAEGIGNVREQQREVLSWQQDTLNQLLASLASRPQTSSCYQCGQDGHSIHDCPKPPPTNTQGERRQALKKMSGNKKTLPLWARGWRRSTVVHPFQRWSVEHQLLQQSWRV